MTKLIHTAVLALVAAAALAQTALAGPINPDPKDEWPFTRPMVGHVVSVNAPANADPKNEWPFTRRVGDVRLHNADPKNEWPFTRRVVGRPSRLPTT